MEVSIVVDLGFGDSGKGLVTDFLTEQALVRGKTPIVARFSGGHQAGHTVVRNGQRHVFSNYGAGSLLGVPSYFSKHCAIFPPAILGEAKAIHSLLDNGSGRDAVANKVDPHSQLSDFNPLQHISPILTVDPLSVVTTPYDIAYNRITEAQNKHGSCGLGITATFLRSQVIPLYALELTNDWVLRQKIQAILEYYNNKMENHKAWQEEISLLDKEKFIRDCQLVAQSIAIKNFSCTIQGHNSIIFEGSQGILLDRLHGIYPHVTYADTTSKNAWELLDFGGIVMDHGDSTEHKSTHSKSYPFGSMPLDSDSTDRDNASVHLYYVTRAYQTRHGKGPMNEIPAPSGLTAIDSTNLENPFQGKLRFSGLDISLLKHSIQIDSLYHAQNADSTKNLVVTCTDHIPGWTPDSLAYLVGTLESHPNAIHGYLRNDKTTGLFQNVYYSCGPSASDIKHYKRKEYPR